MRTVTCQTPGCANYQTEISVPDDGTEVICGGGCNQVLAEQDDDKCVPPVVGPSPLELQVADLQQQVAALQAQIDGP